MKHLLFIAFSLYVCGHFIAQAAPVSMILNTDIAISLKYVAGENSVSETNSGQTLTEHPLTFQRENFNASLVGFSFDSRTLIVFKGDEIQFWDTTKWLLRHRIENKNIGSPLALSADGKKLTASTTNYRMQVWNVETGKLFRNLSGFRTNMVFSPDATLMAGNGVASNGGADATVRVWNALTGERIHTFPNPYYKTRFYFSPDNKFLAGAEAQLGKDSVEIWNLETGRLVSNTIGQGDVAAPVVFSPDGKIFATAGIDPNWRLPEDGPNGPCCSDGGAFVDYVAKLWDVRTGKLLRMFKGWTSLSSPYSPVGFTTNGQKMLCQLGDQSYPQGVEILDAATGKKLSKISKGSDDNFLLSPNGKILVAGGETLRVWKFK